MKTSFKTLGLLFFGILTLNSCDKTDENTIAPMPEVVTAAKFNAIRTKGIGNKTQTFAATAGSGTITLTSAKGVVITLNGDALTKNGSPVTGAIEVTFIELFDKGSMLVTNKPTMGMDVDGKKKLLKSGGEFFIKATQGGVELATTATISLKVPGTLTGTGKIDTGMLFWQGDTTDAENLVWKQPDANTAGGKRGFVEGDQKANNYLVSFGNFGWTNVDKFYSDPRPRTTILAEAPATYDNTNSAIYLSYDGEGNNALAKLDTYDSVTKRFSEHYGQIPIGLACHIIFVTEQSGQWRYAIKAVTISANAVYTFTMAETTVGSEAQLVAAINAIQ